MTIHIVDNKKLDMVEQEWEMYQNIVTAYSVVPNQRGEDLFIDLFESDDSGIITLIKPPSKHHTSMEVFLFVLSLMNSQHMRIMYSVVEDMCEQMKAKMDKIDEKLALIK